jgi:hypothetical protein
VRAALAATPGGAREFLERSLHVAASQGARWFALRSATDRAELTAGTLDAPAARRALAQLVGEFSEGFARADLVRARRVLEGAAR